MKTTLTYNRTVITIIITHTHHITLSIMNFTLIKFNEWKYSWNGTITHGTEINRGDYVRYTNTNRHYIETPIDLNTNKIFVIKNKTSVKLWLEFNRDLSYRCLWTSVFIIFIRYKYDILIYSLIAYVNQQSLRISCVSSTEKTDIGLVWGVFNILSVYIFEMKLPQFYGILMFFPIYTYNNEKRTNQEELTFLQY